MISNVSLRRNLGSFSAVTINRAIRRRFRRADARPRVRRGNPIKDTGREREARRSCQPSRVRPSCPRSAMKAGAWLDGPVEGLAERSRWINNQKSVRRKNRSARDWKPIPQPPSQIGEGGGRYFCCFTPGGGRCLRHPTLPGATIISLRWSFRYAAPVRGKRPERISRRAI